MLTKKRVLRELELLDWGGHVELPMFDMDWLATQLAIRLNNTTDTEICEACGKPAPIVIQTKLGNICAECVEDMSDNVDQIKETMDNQ
jgi:hypothetical protein